MRTIELISEPPNAPRHLSKHAQEIWHVATRALIVQGKLVMTHTPQLAAYCNEVAKYWEYERLLAASEPVITYYNEMGVQTKTVISPYVTLANMALNNAMRLSSKFGFDPATHDRIMNAPEQKEEKDDFEQAMLE